MSKTLSPAQAAQRSGVSRWTIIRAIQATEIEALRDNRNHWKININSLDKWCIARGAHTVLAQVDAPDAQADTASKVRIAELETETRMLKVQLDEVKQDRDAWRDQAKELSTQKRGFFSFFRKPSE